MSVDIELKGIPDAVAESLRRRAAEHNHSLDQEVVEILKATLEEKPTLTPAEFVAQVRAKGISTPAEAAAMVREDRDARGRD